MTLEEWYKCSCSPHNPISPQMFANAPVGAIVFVRYVMLEPTPFYETLFDKFELTSDGWKAELNSTLSKYRISEYTAENRVHVFGSLLIDAGEADTLLALYQLAHE